ncbi:glycosyltransferase family 9 protein [Nocardia puris]|uniref:glycosyltransferase family 9 protein n=1 Tax=Nocardia puris TaxID=208602 RepID=UPI0018955438|nr:glycosyltransferase family 9 protein [Nocardia puris]MBF6216064.1 glycosyltransferase family 9 protein [Nocardia puris]
MNATDLPLTTSDFFWRPDCRHFIGGLPCQHWRPCPGCTLYDPVTHRILIVMLKRMGDMLIASPLPARIKAEHPGAHITWLVGAESAPIVEMIPHVDRILTWDTDTAHTVLAEHYDAVYSFERHPAVAGLVPRISAEHHAGLAYGGENNSLYPLGDPARHFFAMNTWNDFRTSGNSKTWTELYFEVAGYVYTGEPYQLSVPDAAKARVAARLGTSGAWVCLNVGGSKTTKLWPTGRWADLGRRLLDDGHRLVITGGPADARTCHQLLRELDTGVGRVRHDAMTLQEFAAVPDFCDAMVTGDSLGFHLALAYDLPVVLLLGPSNGAEVIPKHADNVTALRSTLPCSPCAHQVTCGGIGGCMDTITVADVHGAVRNSLSTAAVREG